MIRNKIEQMKSSEDESSTKREDILSRFLQATETDPTYLRDIILNFIIAGRDTTATTLSWFIYLLCKHPHLQDKVVKELREVTNAKEVTNFVEFVYSLSEVSLEKMQYLQAAITETLRIYPEVPVDAKICSDDTFPDGFALKKGDMVVYEPYAMSRMKFIWGDDAEQFRPGRWLNQEGIFQPESPFRFIAFQAGPRICLGKEFAYRQLKIFAAILPSCFVFRMNDEEKKVQYRTRINLHIHGGLQVRVFHRNEN